MVAPILPAPTLARARPDRPTACPVCGQLVPAGPSRACPNRWCRRADRHFSVAFSVGVHRGALRAAITRYKYRGERRLAAVFAASLASYLESHPAWFEEFDLITAVPAYSGAGARRAWDPVGSILGALSDRLGSEWTVDGAAVIKTGETPGMAGRSWAGRQAVAGGPLRRSLAVPDPGLVAGRQVLVVDDVLTEGSTLREVARVLLQAGASDVAGLVLARPPWMAQAPA